MGRGRHPVEVGAARCGVPYPQRGGRRLGRDAARWLPPRHPGPQHRRRALPEARPAGQAAVDARASCTRSRGPSSGAGPVARRAARRPSPTRVRRAGGPAAGGGANRGSRVADGIGARRRQPRTRDRRAERAGHEVPISGASVEAPDARPVSERPPGGCAADLWPCEADPWRRAWHRALP